MSGSNLQSTVSRGKHGGKNFSEDLRFNVFSVEFGFGKAISFVFLPYISFVKWICLF